MKVLVLSDLYPPHSVGGYELRCHEIVGEISRRGHDVSVLTIKWPDDPPDDGPVHRLLYASPFRDVTPADHQFDILRLNRRWHQLAWAYRTRSNYAMTRQLAKDLKPDLVFVWNMQYLGPSPVLAVQDLGIPTAFNLEAYWLSNLKTELVSDPSPVKRLYRTVMFGIGDFADLDLRHLIAISQSLKDSYVEVGFPGQSITVIPRGVPSEWILDDSVDLTAFANGKDGIRLLLVARLCPEKAPDTAIRAISFLVNKYQRQDVCLDLVGTGSAEYLDELKVLVTSSGLDKYVHFLGAKEHSEVIGLYAKYGALIFPSRWVEPLGGVILEAMSKGLPVIATARGGAPEIIVDGENGLLVPVDEPEVLADRIFQLFSDETHLIKLRHNALRTVRENYSNDVIVRRTLKYLSTVLEEDRRGEGK
jgi:glycosyltransferase involved in cell wall biosynthesis